MDCILNENFTHMLSEYGSIVLFFLLALGIVALPIPDETLLVISGALVANGILHLHSTVISAVAGSLTGITISYILGITGGSFLMQRYGSWFGVTKEKLDKAKDWFDHLGKWALFIGYFIPGVRHFSGFTAGITRVNYKHFALFAYSGGIFWIATFLSLGYFFGDTCFAFLEEIDQKFLILIFAAILVFAGCYLWKSQWKKK
jgi:membrane protein DedA with SNARE-associated domain